MIIQQTNTILYCSRWMATVDFYSAILNFPITFRNTWFVEFQVTSTSFLSIADAQRTSIESVNGQGITLTWQVADVHTIRIDLQKRGIQVTEMKEKWGANVFYLHDPEGHRIEFWQPLPE